jgi:hypothetical protein
MRFIAQRKTRKFVVTQEQQGAYYFTQDEVDQWIASNASDMHVTGNVIIITGDFGNVMDNLGPGAPNTSRFDYRKTLTDLGVEYVIGNPVNSQIITLRLVQGIAPASDGGLGGAVGYVVTENNSTDTPTDVGRFTVRVARV